MTATALTRERRRALAGFYAENHARLALWVRRGAPAAGDAVVADACDHEDELPEPAGPAEDPLNRVIASERHHAQVARFAALKPRERRALLLLAGGYRYHEIAQLTNCSYTAINRQLAEGRARLRQT